MIDNKINIANNVNIPDKKGNEDTNYGHDT